MGLSKPRERRTSSLSWKVAYLPAMVTTGSPIYRKIKKQIMDTAKMTTSPWKSRRAMYVAIREKIL
jgi:hypothetical protein